MKSVGGGSRVSDCAVCANTGVPACTSPLLHMKIHSHTPPKTPPLLHPMFPTFLYHPPSPRATICHPLTLHLAGKLLEILVFVDSSLARYPSHFKHRTAG